MSRNVPIIKNQQFLPNQADIQAIFTKFHKYFDKSLVFLCQSYFLHQSLFHIGIIHKPCGQISGYFDPSPLYGLM